MNLLKVNLNPDYWANNYLLYLFAACLFESAFKDVRRTGCRFPGKPAKEYKNVT